MNKLAIRKKFRALRAAVSPDERESMALDAANIFKSHPIFQASRHIACYCAYGQEFQTMSIIDAIWAAGKVCYLPALADSKTLNFVQYNQDDELQPNQHLIPEPVSNQHVIHPEKLDLVLVPLLAFDKLGNRIGTGGGFYDRTFAFMYTQPEKSPFLLGLGYTFQECPDIQSEPWDVKLCGMLTEKYIALF